MKKSNKGEDDKVLTASSGNAGSSEFSSSTMGSDQNKTNQVKKQRKKSPLFY